MDQQRSLSTSPRSCWQRTPLRDTRFWCPPGEYALSGFRLKLAASTTDVQIYEGDAAHLIEGGKAKGGSFRVAAGEIVYIGHFAVDCDGNPTPWRFYIEDPQDFSKYSADFHREFPATRYVPVTFRLFETDTFGKPYVLPDQAMEPKQ